MDFFLKKRCIAIKIKIVFKLNWLFKVNSRNCVFFRLLLFSFFLFVVVVAVVVVSKMEELNDYKIT